MDTMEPSPSSPSLSQQASRPLLSQTSPSPNCRPLAPPAPPSLPTRLQASAVARSVCRGEHEVETRQLSARIERLQVSASRALPYPLCAKEPCIHPPLPILARPLKGGHHHYAPASLARHLGDGVGEVNMPRVAVAFPHPSPGPTIGPDGVRRCRHIIRKKACEARLYLNRICSSVRTLDQYFLIQTSLSSRKRRHRLARRA